jgi:hypothetical protein
MALITTPVAASASTPTDAIVKPIPITVITRIVLFICVILSPLLIVIRHFLKDDILSVEGIRAV